MHNKISALTLTLLVAGHCLTVADPLLTAPIVGEKISSTNNTKPLPTARELTKSILNVGIDAYYDAKEANRAFNPNKGAALATEFKNSSKLAFNYKPEEEKLTLDVSRIQRDYGATGILVATNMGAAVATWIAAILLIPAKNASANIAHLLPYGTFIGYSEVYKAFERNNAETNSYYYYATNQESFDFCKTTDGKWELVNTVDNQEIKNSLEKIVNTYDVDHYVSSEALNILEKIFTAQKN